MSCAVDHLNARQCREILDQLTDGVYFVDRDRRISYWNTAAERLTGYRANEVVGRSCKDDMLIHVDGCGTCLCRTGCPLAATIDDGQQRSAELYLKHKRGHRLAVRVRATPLVDDAGRIVGAAEIFNAVGNRDAYQHRMDELQTLAFADPLTRLANRRYLEQALVRQLADAARDGWQLGVMLIDVDRFGQLNAMHGFAVGNRVLQIVADDIGDQMRAFDVAGRFGDDQFLVLQPHAGAGHLLATADRLRMLIRRSHFNIETGRVNMTASVAATLGRDHDTAAIVIDRITSLMTVAKQAGGNRTHDDLGQ